jgi:thioredoxin
MSNTPTISSDQFANEVAQQDGFTLVDFYADWCGPCKMVASVVDSVAEEYKDRLKVVKVDADASTELVAKFGVRGLPTLMLFKDGEPVGSKTGALSLNALRAFVDAA